MIADLKPYSEYKESGWPWLGQVPGHWGVKPLRSMLKQRNEKNNPIKIKQVLSLSIAKGVTLYSHEGRGGNKAKSDLSAYKIAYPNDIVLNSMNVVVGAVGLSKYLGLISPVYYALYAMAEDVDINYFNKIFSNQIFQRFLLIYGKGILIKEGDSGKLNTIRMKISPEDLKSTLLPLPPSDEQAAIVRFLDWANGRLDRAIRAKRKLIALLNEQKQAIIHRAVTRGLDPDVPLKDSGVEWLGEVPEHWEVVPLKRISKIIDGDRSQEYPTIEDFVPEGIPFLSSRAIKNGRLRYDDLPFISQKKYEALGKGKLQAGDIVMTVRGTIGNCALFIGDIYQTGFINAQMMILRSDTTKVLPLYLLQQFRSSYFKEFLDYKAFGSAQKQLTNQILAGIPMPMPSLAVQTDILHSIDKATAGIDSAITHTNREIKLLNEYRTCLIADVVTGKIDVREVAATIPPEVDPLAANGEPDDTLDNDTEADLDELDPIPEEDEA